MLLGHDLSGRADPVAMAEFLRSAAEHDGGGVHTSTLMLKSIREGVR